MILGVRAVSLLTRTVSAIVGAQDRFARLTRLCKHFAGPLHQRFYAPVAEPAADVGLDVVVAVLPRSVLPALPPPAGDTPVITPHEAVIILLPTI